MLLSGLAARAIRWAPYALAGGLLSYLVILGTGRPFWLSNVLRTAFGRPTHEDLAIVVATLAALIIAWADRRYLEHKRLNARKWQEWKIRESWEDGG